MIRKKLITQRIRKTSLVLVLITLLIIPFQNCKKFESNEGLVESSSSTGNALTGSTNSDGSMTDNPDEGAQGDLAAETARQARCKSNIKKPIIINASSINNSVFNLKSGLANTSGDANSAENKDIIIDDSKGVINPELTTPKFNGGDGCVYVTTIRIDTVNDTGRPASLTHALDFSGNSLVTGSASTNFGIIRNALTTNPTNNNNNNFATNTLNFRVNITNNNNRNARCVQGSVWYAVRVRVSTQSLPANAQLDSDPIYFKANVVNSCWSEKKLVATSDYLLNAKAGSRVAMDGSWAAVLSQSDSNKGAIFIFNKNASGNWIFTQKLTTSDAATGHNLSNLDLKGNLLAVSNASHNSKGKVYVFKNSGSIWSESQQISAYENTILYQQFGLGLSLGNNFLAIGAPSHPKSGALGSDTGKVYIYNLNSGNGLFEYAQALEGSNESHFGFGKNILASGTKMFIGAPDSVNNSSGRLFVFNKATSWSQELAITPPTSIKAAAGFGSAIAFNGTALAVGAPFNDRDATNADSGTVYYYKSYTGSLTHAMNGAAAGFKFGTSLAFGSDSLYVGCTGCGANQSGVVFRKLISNIESTTASNRDLNAYVNFSHDNTNTESFGQSIDSDGGNTILIGAPSKDSPNLKSGAAYIYTVK